MAITANISDFYKFNVGLDLMNIIRGIDFFRCLEYPLVLSNLDVEKGHKVLDIGSRNSIFPLFLASKDCRVHATDVDELVFRQIQWANKIGLNKNANFIVDLQDVTGLSYPDNFFDRITAISTIEHIKNDGDIKAMKEIARVLSPEGRAVLTVPFRRIYEEHGQNIGKYEDASFFERRYDEKAMLERLIKPSGLSVRRIQYFGEKNFQFSKIWENRYLRIPLHPFTPLFSRLFLTTVEKKDYDNMEPGNLNKYSGGVCLALEKTG